MASFESIHIYRNIANIFIHNEQQIYVYKYTCVYIYLHHGVLYVYVSMYLHTVSVHMLHLCTNLSTCLSFYLYLFSKMHIELCVYIYICRTCILKQKGSNTIFSVLILFSYWPHNQFWNKKQVSWGHIFFSSISAAVTRPVNSVQLGFWPTPPLSLK